MSILQDGRTIPFLSGGQPGTKWDDDYHMLSWYKNWTYDDKYDDIWIYMI